MRKPQVRDLKKFKNNQNGVGADNDSNFDQVDPGVGVLLLFSCMYKKEDIALYILNSPIFKYINYNQIIKFDHTLYFYNETDATAFIYACKNSMTDVINRFIIVFIEINSIINNKNIYNFDINIQDIYGKTILHYICENNLIENFKNLYENKVSREALNMNIKDKRGFTPLMTAIASGNIEIAELLFKIRDVYGPSEDFIKIYMPNKVNRFRQILHRKDTLLHLATKNQQTRLFRKNKINTEDKKIYESTLISKIKQILQKILEKIELNNLNNYEKKMIKTIYEITKKYSIEDIKANLKNRYPNIVKENSAESGFNLNNDRIFLYI